MLAHLVEKHNLGQFAKIRKISAYDVSPEIDLLEIDKEKQIAIGYELKVLKYRKKYRALPKPVDVEPSKRVDIAPLYTGIGQMILYLQHGVDRSYLLVALSPDLDIDTAKAMIKKIDEVASSLRFLRSLPTSYRYPFGNEPAVNTYQLDCIGVKFLNPWSDKIETKLEAERDYLGLNHQETRNRNACLINGDFIWDSTFLTKWKRKKTQSKTEGAL